MINPKKLGDLQQKIEQACRRAKRDPSSVRIVAVSKGHPVSQILEAYALGLRDFGENYVVELDKKRTDHKLQLPDIRWHYVGHIQSNKLRSLAATSWVHTLAETSHAQMLSRLVPEGATIQALLQVNLGKESQRSGVFPEDVFARYSAMMNLARLNMCGLMTIAPMSHDPAFWFSKMATLKNELEHKLGVRIPELSMGMSGDMEEAIAHGATWIRVGTLLFGERENKSQD